MTWKEWKLRRHIRCEIRIVDGLLVRAKWIRVFALRPARVFFANERGVAAAKECGVDGVLLLSGDV